MEKTNVMQNLRLNLVLLGRTGAGKSSSGNTILGREAFISEKSSNSVNQDFAGEVGDVCRLPITVYDTPGFSVTESEEELRKYEEVLKKCESGLCAFLMVLQCDRFTEEDQETVEKIEKLLGEKRMQNTWILFTGEDQLKDENKSINHLIKETDALKILNQKYEGRFHSFNNKEKEPRNQVDSLISKVFLRNLENLQKKTQQRIPINIQDIPVDSRLSRRIVLLGKSGVGKSAAGNTILGQKEFKSVRSASSVTSECSVKHATVSDRSVSVVDTPGFFDTSIKPEEIEMEIARSVYESSPGPHAFLIVLRVIDRFTKQEQQIPQMIEMMFGQEVLKYSIILFTNGDQLEDETIEELINNNNKLKDLVGHCGGRYHVLNNRDQKNRDQVNDLLQKIDTMIEQNGGGHYSNQMFEDALRFRREEEERRKQQMEKEIQEEIERVRKETEEKIRAEFEEEGQRKEEIEKVMQAEEERIRAEAQLSPVPRLLPCSTILTEIWKSVNTLELEIAGEGLSTHTQETRNTEGRRHAGDR
ncbi:GTPase IMAP family member 8 [Anabarilius grahami]|uniref:GTPase IMAP family member 8 n=1 Tax=Anabarilius grahami TaxID=495550 RepID=A0A3N0Y935_ANAGA|nr:GTPase IMAP family member 8 [Anabarilius grahami]